MIRHFGSLKKITYEKSFVFIFINSKISFQLWCDFLKSIYSVSRRDLIQTNFFADQGPEPSEHYILKICCSHKWVHWKLGASLRFSEINSLRVSRTWWNFPWTSSLSKPHWPTLPSFVSSMEHTIVLSTFRNASGLVKRFEAFFGVWIRENLQKFLENLKNLSNGK